MISKITCRANIPEQNGILHSFSYSILRPSTTRKMIEFGGCGQRQFLSARICSFAEGFWPYSCMISRELALICCSTGTRSTETQECTRSSEDCANARDQSGDGDGGGCVPHSSQFLAEACRFVHNDAKYVNKRAHNDIILLSRGITRLNNCAQQHIVLLGLRFLKLDAHARAYSEKINLDVKEKAAYLHHIAAILKDRAHSDLKRASDQHWSDGALEADLRRANFMVIYRAMKDAYMALKFIQNIHDMMATKIYQLQVHQRLPMEDSCIANDKMRSITLENNLDTSDDEVTLDCMHSIQDAYWSMASALSEVDVIDYTDPEELELLVAALIDLDAMDGRSSVSLLAECSCSPDVNTRKALANALATAPSLWILGNAGMGALQRLAQDSNPAVADAASKAIGELKQKWELEEGDSVKFMKNHFSQEEEDRDDNNKPG